MAEPFLELVDISKIYPGVVALDHVGLSVSRGEVIALIGENGAGKSTLMRVLGGVVEPSGGVIRAWSLPPIRITPSLGAITPPSTRISVDLPAPFSPIRPNTSPR